MLKEVNANSELSFRRLSPPHGVRVIFRALQITMETVSRINLVRAGRQWRKGLKSHIVADKPLPFKEKVWTTYLLQIARIGEQHGILYMNGILFQQESAKLYRETWEVYEDNENSELVLGPRLGDLRASLAPFLANASAGKSAVSALGLDASKRAMRLICTPEQQAWKHISGSFTATTTLCSSSTT